MRWRAQAGQCSDRRSHGVLAGGRPVVVVTDGEVEDGAMRPAGAIERAQVRVLPRATGPTAGMVSLDGPSRVTVTDTIRLRGVVRSRGVSEAGVAVTVVLGSKELARRTVALQGDASVAVELALPPGTVQAGDQVLSVGVTDSLEPERPKLRCQFAEFLHPSSLKRLRILIPPTCVRLRYGLRTTEV